MRQNTCNIVCIRTNAKLTRRSSDLATLCDESRGFELFTYSESTSHLLYLHGQSLQRWCQQMGRVTFRYPDSAYMSQHRYS